MQLRPLANGRERGFLDSRRPRRSALFLTSAWVILLRRLKGADRDVGCSTAGDAGSGRERSRLVRELGL